MVRQGVVTFQFPFSPLFRKRQRCIASREEPQPGPPEIGNWKVTTPSTTFDGAGPEDSGPTASSGGAPKSKDGDVIDAEFEENKD
ncbi:MAG: hypothetical protein M0R80_15575 [Proteobacteria bacterium]|nr:hypothetical protein [Pseudomonadota bacterium]